MGLRNLNLELMNKALMAKWLWKLKTKSGLWENIVLNKYVQIEGLAGLKPKVGNSHFLSNLMKIKDVFYQHCKKIVGNIKTQGFGRIGGLVINL